MKCVRCNVDMEIGKAIDYNDKPFPFFRYRLNKDTLKLINVLKCPRCGHSDRIEESF